MIDLNATFFVQFVNFLLILILLNVILIGPIRRMLKKRAEHMAAQMGSIEDFTASADNKLKGYEQALDAARQEAGAARLRMKEEGLAKEKAVLDEAGAAVAASLKSSRADIGNATEAARTTLAAGVTGLASKAVGKILGGAA